MRLFRSLPSISPREAAATHIPLGRLRADLHRIDHDRPVAFLCQGLALSTKEAR
jgi:rhodanese-related sulfurtransferase